jgi:hypothetical protein
MRRFVFLLVGLVLAGAIAVTVMDFGKPPPPEHGGTTGDRLSSEQMARMVAGPMKLVAKKDLAGGARLFEAELAKARAKGACARATCSPPTASSCARPTTTRSRSPTSAGPWTPTAPPPPAAPSWPWR